ncbi:MAG: SDR family oxidoreductase, partial [Selenomonadaceae bacterium]
TEMNEALLDQSNPRYKEITDRIPAHRWGTGNDMKGTCIYLSSSASDYLGGAVIPVDGGYLVK